SRCFFGRLWFFALGGFFWAAGTRRVCPPIGGGGPQPGPPGRAGGWGGAYRAAGAPEAVAARHFRNFGSGMQRPLELGVRTLRHIPGHLRKIGTMAAKTNKTGRSPMR